MAVVDTAVKAAVEAAPEAAEVAVKVVAPAAKKAAIFVAGAVAGSAATLFVQRIVKKHNDKKMREVGAPDAELDAAAEDGNYEEVNPTD